MEEGDNIVRNTDVKEEEATNTSIKEEEKVLNIKATKISSNSPGNEKKEKKRRNVKSVPPSINACQFCGKIFRFRNSMYKHERKHTGVKYKCEECGECYKNKDYLKHHKCKPGDKNQRKAEREKEKPTYTCKECGNIYWNKESLKIHINIIHSIIIV